MLFLKFYFSYFYFMYKNIAITYKDMQSHIIFLGWICTQLVSHTYNIILKFLSKVNNLCDLKSLTYNKNRINHSKFILQFIYSHFFACYQKINSLTAWKKNVLVIKIYKRHKNRGFIVFLRKFCFIFKWCFENCHKLIIFELLINIWT